MHHIAQALAHRRIATFRYDYPYSHRLETGYTEDLIDPLDILLATTRAAIQAAQDLAPDLPLFLAGRSMSGQVMSLLLAREPLPHVRGLICYVYPTRWHALLNDTVAHPRCHSEVRRGISPSVPDPMSNPTLAHLPQVPVPTLFIQGARDPEYSDLTQLQSVLNQLGSPSARREPGRSPRRTASNPTLHVIQDADHSFNLPPHSTKTQQDAIEEAASATATWIQIQLETPAHYPPAAT